TAACKKDKDGGSCNLPSTAVPSNVTGDWVNGYTSFTQVLDAYNGRVLGSTWQSGRFLSLKSNGKDAELYIMGGSQFSEFATWVKGSVEFDEDNNFFKFNVCQAHYKGWQGGALTVDRDATDSERAQLSENLQFYYDFETSGNTTYLQLAFDPQGSASSFRKVK
ncbi:MAG TPA: hypothetical protein VD996_10400, partial [Chitinophagaceae bacterium]|nr:hypothetical protein [Chitinophagaceae bacterium]